MEGEWHCKHPFGIDTGELDGIPPHECFVLGVEWQMLFAQLESEEHTFTRMIHEQNAMRLAALCKQLGRKCKLQSLDKSGWYEIEVLAKDMHYQE